MVSTYTGYRFYAADMQRSLARTAAEPQVQREAEYYKANIGKVRTVDEFLKNDRLYRYAMRAAGLTDMVDAKAFMRKVLTSDLTDAKSFARMLADTRYQTFAASFNFDKTGKIGSAPLVAQTEDQESETIGLYSSARVRAGQAASADVAAYRAALSSVTDVDNFLVKPALVDFALRSVGLSPTTTDRTILRDVLTSDTADPASIASQKGGAFLALANSFTFAADGSLTGSAQTSTQLTATVVNYFEAMGAGASAPAAAFRAEQYRALVPTLTTLDDLLGNEQALSVVKTSFGLDASIQPAFFEALLTSDLSDPDSFANTFEGGEFRAVAEAFNFETDGSLAPGASAQDTSQIDAIIAGFMSRYDSEAKAADRAASTYYKSRMLATVNGQAVALKSVDELLANAKLYDFVMTAYDLDPDVESKTVIRKVLTSDFTDPNSYANRSGNPKYRTLAAAFNFTATGAATTEHAAQIGTDELVLIRRYNGVIAASGTAEEKAGLRAANTYYDQVITAVDTVDELLADKKVTTYILRAFGLEKDGVSPVTLRQVLTSDPLDPKSAAAKLNDKRYRDLSAMFNFDANGRVKRVPANEVQSRTNMLKIADQFLSQTMETSAGATSEGVRLSLYFRRKAGDLTSAYGILADKALIEVTRTALGLPASMSNLKIEAQAALIDKKLKVADLKDPAKLDKFIARFGAMYDLAQTQASQGTSPTLALFGGTGSSASRAFDTSLIQRLQSL